MTKYKTIEDFKNQIPEGATHYTNENSRHSFAFYKLDSGFVYIMFAYTCNTWMRTKYAKLDEIENLIALEPAKQPKFKYVPVNSDDIKFGDEYYFVYESGNAEKIIPLCIHPNEKSTVILELTSKAEIKTCTVLDVCEKVEITEEDELVDFLTEFEKEFIKLSDKCLKTALDRFRNFKLD